MNCSGNLDDRKLVLNAITAATTAGVNVNVNGSQCPFLC
jgi:hypothetical protein